MRTAINQGQEEIVHTVCGQLIWLQRNHFDSVTEIVSTVWTQIQGHENIFHTVCGKLSWSNLLATKKSLNPLCSSKLKDKKEAPGSTPSQGRGKNHRGTCEK